MQHIKHGYAQIMAHKRMILVLYGLNLLFAILCVLPFFFLLNKAMGNSLVGQLPGSLENLNAIADLVINNDGGFTASMGSMFAALVLSLVFSLAISGGILTVLHKGEGYQSALFWGGAGNWFGPFLRHLLLSIPLLILPGIFLGLLKLSQYLIWGDDPYQYVTYYGDRVALGILVLGFFWWQRVLDQGRNLMVTTGNRAARKAMWRGFRLVMSNFGACMGVGLAFAIPAAILLIGHSMMRISLTNITLLFILTQFYIVLRQALKMGLIAGQLDQFQAIQPPEMPVQDPAPASIEESEQPEPESAAPADLPEEGEVTT